MELVGYARVSTREQKLDLQLEALRGHGCTKVFMEGEMPEVHLICTVSLSSWMNVVSI